jgi:predicted negative regulator of RcsB-dependent stress response
MKAAFLPAAMSFSVASGQTPPEPSAPAPVPDAEARKRARALVADIFKAEPATKAADKRARLAATLLEQALKTGGDAALRFVLLQESAAVAADVGEADTALRALDELSERFRIDVVEEKGPVLEKSALSARAADAHVRIAEEALAVSDAALTADVSTRP